MYIVLVGFSQRCKCLSSGRLRTKKSRIACDFFESAYFVRQLPGNYFHYIAATIFDNTQIFVIHELNGSVGLQDFLLIR